MGDLYSIVKRVVNSSDLNEANDKLFGVEGIHINSDEYFQTLTSNFIKKKEYTIKRINGELIFDLNNYNDLWNIIFIGEYIKENDILNKEYEEALKRVLKKGREYYDEYLAIVAEHTAPGVVNHAEINKRSNLKIQEMKDYFRSLFSFIDKEFPSLKTFDKLERFITNGINSQYSKVIETFYKIDWVKLENSNSTIDGMKETELLKQSINIIHKLRNCFEHGGVDSSKTLKINNSNFNVSIPIDYLNGYSKGRIKAKESDKVIVERTNLIASPLLEEIGYDVKDVESFFYSVNTEYLAWLLEHVNYEYDELYKLKSEVFYSDDLITYVVDNNLLKFSDAVLLPDDILVNYSNVLLYLDKGFTIDEIKGFGLNLLNHFETTMLLKDYGFSIEELNNFSIKAFFNEYDLPDLLNKKIDKEDLKQLLTRLEPRDILSLLDNELSAKDIIRLIEREDFSVYDVINLIVRGFTVEDILELPILVYNIAEVYDEGLTIEQIKKIRTDNILNYYFYNKYLEKGFSIEEINNLNDDIIWKFNEVLFLLENGLSISEINELPDDAFSYDEVYKYLLRSKLSDEELKQLPPIALMIPSAVLDYLEKGLTVNEISKLPNEKFPIALHIYNYYKGILSYEELGCIPIDYLYNIDNILKLHEVFSAEEIGKLSKEAIILSDSTLLLYNNNVTIDQIKELNPLALSDVRKTIDLLNNGYTIDEINQLPDKAFVLSGIDFELLKRRFSYDEIHEIFFGDKEKVLSLLDKGFDKEDIKEFLKKDDENEEGYVSFDLLDRLDIIDCLIDNDFTVDEIKKIVKENYLLTKDGIKLITSVLSKEEILEISDIAFDSMYVESIIELLNNNFTFEDIKRLSKGAFIHPENVIKLRNDDIDVFKITDNVWYLEDFNSENIKILLDLVDNNYKRLEEFPYEFFYCDITLIDNMYKNYSLNVVKSIFGINNSKLIGTLVYCDNVFRNYDKHDFDYELIDLDPMEVVKIGANDTYKYRDNISGMDDKLENYKRQFVYHSNGDIRMVNGEFNLKANILDKLRNSVCHFRFKPVKDDKGELVEDKIYIYDKDDNGVINFNMILDIKDLVEIAREVELDLVRKQVSIDFNQVEANRFRVR